MIEIRLHGKGGQGVVKASQIVVQAAVASGINGQFIPFFGVERKGSPVYGYLRLSREEIRRKTQIYEPDVLVVMDDSLTGMPQTYAGLKSGGKVVINTTKSLEELGIPDCAGSVIACDATGISEKLFGKNLPNTAMLGALAHILTIVDRTLLLKTIESTFGAQNRRAAETAFDETRILKSSEAV
jgi:2-oxoacid:acceptor oxidoreductase, gamma subunit, pyruvate/2-ketoisovalerate family